MQYVFTLDWWLNSDKCRCDVLSGTSRQSARNTRTALFMAALFLFFFSAVKDELIAKNGSRFLPHHRPHHQQIGEWAMSQESSSLKGTQSFSFLSLSFSISIRCSFMHKNTCATFNYCWKSDLFGMGLHEASADWVAFCSSTDLIWVWN